jgi:SAM-dependent methyltransferase
MSTLGVDPDVANILGEVLWHSATLDESILEVSKDHADKILNCKKKYLPNRAEINFLEVAAYAHVTGYLLANDQGWSCTLSDISVETLSLGKSQAEELGLINPPVRRVAVDFHDLPFNDGEFDIVYISSALHHTLRWQKVLEELFRVTNNGGILIIQNEPLERKFCLYKFPANREESYRKSELALKKAGILSTVAEPYPGTRPETLFGMIENQRMPLREILDILNQFGIIQELAIDSSICMSDFDHEILNASRHEPSLKRIIENGLIDRIKLARDELTFTDGQIGINIPSDRELSVLASKASNDITNLPSPDSAEYKIAIGSIFGGAVSTVIQRESSEYAAKHLGELRYQYGERKGVIIGLPSYVMSAIEGAIDVAPDIQDAAPDEIFKCFPEENWSLGSSDSLRFLVLKSDIGAIKLRTLGIGSHYLVLVRLYGSPIDDPFTVSLSLGSSILDQKNFYQAESLLMRNDFIIENGDYELTLSLSDVDGKKLSKLPIITIAAIRIVCLDVEANF